MKHLLFFLVACILWGCSTASPPPAKTLRFNLHSEPPTLDPARAIDTTSAGLLYNLYEGLTRLGKEGEPLLALADSVTIDEGGKLYTFHLRETSWSNGDPLTAEDFVFSWRRTLSPSFPSPSAYKLYLIKNGRSVKEGKLPEEELGIRALDPRTLQITLEHPAPYLLELLALPTFYPLNRRVVDPNEEWAYEAGPLYTSNGPFILSSWTHESEITLAKNPFYWDRDNVFLDTIEFMMIEETHTEFYLFEQGDLDWIGSPLSSIPTDFIPMLLAEKRLETLPNASIYFYNINVTHPILHNQSFRQALALAIDRQAIVDHILQGGQKSATALIPPMPGWKGYSYFADDAQDQARYHFNQALKEMGYTLETLPLLTLSYNTYRDHQKIAQAIQQNWSEVLGLEVTLENSDWKVYLDKIHSREYDIARSGWIADFSDPLAFLEPFTHPFGERFNDTGWDNLCFRELIERAEHMRSSSERTDLLHEAEALLMEEMPIIPLFYQTFSFMKKPWVEGVILSRLGLIDLKGAKRL